MSFHGHFNLEERENDTHFTGAWVDSELDWKMNSKISVPAKK
jgi:hypothetical protein